MAHKVFKAQDAQVPPPRVKSSVDTQPSTLKRRDKAAGLSNTPPKTTRVSCLRIYKPEAALSNYRLPRVEPFRVVHSIQQQGQSMRQPHTAWSQLHFFHQLWTKQNQTQILHNCGPVIHGSQIALLHEF